MRGVNGKKYWTTCLRPVVKQCLHISHCFGLPPFENLFLFLNCFVFVESSREVICLDRLKTLSNGLTRKIGIGLQKVN